MSEIVCSSCMTPFTVDEASNADIVRQVESACKVVEMDECGYSSGQRETWRAPS